MYISKGVGALTTLFMHNLCYSIVPTNNSLKINTIAHKEVSTPTYATHKKTSNNSRVNDFHSVNTHEPIGNIKSVSLTSSRDVYKSKIIRKCFKTKSLTSLKRRNITKKPKITDALCDDLSYDQISKSSKNRKNKKKTKDVENESVLESNSDYEEEKDSTGLEYDELRHQLKEGEEFLDFSALAKMKTFTTNNGSDHDSHSEKYFTSKENPYLNQNCSSFSLAEEQNISSGYLDERITRFIKKSNDYPDGGNQLLEDMHKYYCYLKHVNTLVVKKVKRGKIMMKQLVEEDPAFTQIRFDTDELADSFSWIYDEKDAFEKIMDAMCYQWKCLVARHSH